MTGKWRWMWGLLLIIPLLGLSGPVDSLLQVLNRSTRDSNRIVILHALTDQYKRTDQDTAFHYAWQAHQLSKDLKWTRGEAESLYQLGMLYRDKGDVENAKKYLQESADLFGRVPAPSSQATSLRRIAYIYSSDGDYQTANLIYQEALAIARKGDEKEVIAKILSGMSGLCRLQGEYDLAVNYGLQAMEIQEEMGDQDGLTYTLDRLGVVYKLQEDYPKALTYYQRALNLRQASPDKRLSDLAYSSMVIGETYMALDSLPSAERAHRQALHWYKEDGDDSGVAYATYHLGEVARRSKEYQKAKTYLKEARKLFQDLDIPRGEANTLYSLTALMLDQNSYREAAVFAEPFYRIAEWLGSRNHRMNARYFRYLIAKGTNNWKEALTLHEAYLMVKDSLWNENNGAEIARLEAGYTLRQKDQENIQLRLEKELAETSLKAQRQRTIALVGLLLLILISVILLVRVVRKEKVHVHILEKKNQEIEAQRQALVAAEAGLKAINLNLEEIVGIRTEELHRSNEKLEQYAYLASHDLKQPLRTISAFTQLLDREWQKMGAENPRMEEYIQYITGGVKYMNQLIDNILKSSRYAFSDGNKFQQVYLQDILTQVKANLKRQILSSGAQIHAELSDIHIMAVRVKIEQLVQNLLNNAIKFRHPDQAPEIHLSAVEEGDSIILTVRDNGIGIPKESQESIFQMFRQLDQNQEMAGVGLGLTICRKIAEQHGGTISVDSAEGEGSTFSVTLLKNPVENANQAAA